MRSSWLIAILLGSWLTVWVSEATPEAHPKLGDDLQRAVDQSAAHDTAIVVLDVASAKILAARNIDVAANRLARPGSTLKPFVLLQLLDVGKLDAKARLFCKRPLMIGTKRMDCTHPIQIGTLDAADAIAYSCNTYVSDVATRLTTGELVQTLRRAGLDSRTGLARDESAGRVAEPSSVVELQLEALGEWGVDTTPLELLAAYHRLALRARAGNLGTAAPVFEGLEGSVSYGMADAAHVQGLRIAGKTGTASSATSAQTHGFFVGFAPADQPQIVLVVYIDHGRGMDAAAAAQPIFAAFARTWDR
jgi:cell division protein FtsI/penicillin-binding protein 2